MWRVLKTLRRLLRRALLSENGEGSGEIHVLSMMEEEEEICEELY